MLKPRSDPISDEALYESEKPKEQSASGDKNVCLLTMLNQNCGQGKSNLASVRISYWSEKLPIRVIV